MSGGGPDALHPCSAPFGWLAPSQIDSVNLVNRFDWIETGRTLSTPYRGHTMDGVDQPSARVQIPADNKKGHPFGQPFI